MILLTLFLLTAGSPHGDKDFRIEPQPVAWEDLSPTAFDLTWALPDLRTAPGRDLLGEMRRLLELDFEIPGPPGVTYRSFGDLAAAARAVPGDERAAWLEGLSRKAPSLFADWGAGISELLLDDRLKSPEWTPGKDHPRDGLLMADGWDLAEEGTLPWTDIRVQPRLEQGATLFYSDLATLKRIECDYRLYPGNVDANYEFIYPLDGYYFVGEDPRGRPFSSLAIKFKSDLPFPFSSYSTKLDVLNRYGEDGVLQTDIYSKSSDFHWLAGRDVYLPVETSGGEWVAFLVVRHFGFDLKGVPDKAKNRAEAVRATLGNLKRNAEAAFAGPPRNGPEFLHDVPLLGRRD